MNPVLILCLVMSIIFFTMPLIILIIGAVKMQKAIIQAALIWLAVNVALIIALWLLYALKLQYLI